MMLIICLPRQVEQWCKTKASDSSREASLRVSIKETYDAMLSYAASLSSLIAKVRIHQNPTIGKYANNVLRSQEIEYFIL